MADICKWKGREKGLEGETQGDKEHEWGVGGGHFPLYTLLFIGGGRGAWSPIQGRCTVIVAGGGGGMTVGGEEFTQIYCEIFLQFYMYNKCNISS
jgi:hypothetical protein